MNSKTILRQRAATLAVLLCTTTTTVLAQGDAERGAEIGYTCLGCHGIEGSRNGYPSFHVPRLAGQKSEYLKTALTAYRNGERPHPTMQAQAGSLTELDIDDLVAWIATFGEAQDTATAEQVAGVQAAQICVTCHGIQGEDVQPAPPTLAGQHEDYLVHALRQYRNGVRGANVMTAFATTLTDADMQMLAEFYAAQDGVETIDAD